MANFADALTTLADAEQRFVDIVHDVAALYHAGLLAPHHVALYDSARVNLYTAQVLAWGIFASDVRARLPAPLADVVPVPTMAPALPVRANFGSPPPPAPTTSGLGFAPVVIVIGAAEVSIPIWAIAIIAIAAVVAVCYAVAITANTVTALASLQHRLDDLHAYYQTQLTALQNCIAQHVADPAACAAAITPPGVADPDTTDQPADTSWMKWIMGGAGVIVGLGALLVLSRFIPQRSSGPSGGGRRYILTEAT